MKKLFALFLIVSLFIASSVQAQYDNTTTWGIKYNYNGNTKISFFIPATTRQAFITICNLQGSQIKKIVDGKLISTRRFYLTD